MSENPCRPREHRFQARTGPAVVGLIRHATP